MSISQHSSEIDTTHLHEVPTEVESATEKYAEIQSQYPAYYRAWRSMASNYGKNAVCIEWRGVFGLMKFIEDTSSLPNNPTSHTGSKLKRKIRTLAFSPQNVYWKLPVRNMQSAAVTQSVQSTQTVELPYTLEHYINLPRTKQQELFDSIMEANFQGHPLTQQEEMELNILGKLLSGKELLPEVSVSKYEDI
jgi:hypothetical protein